MIHNGKQFLRSIRLSPRFFVVCAGIVLCFALSFGMWFLFPVALSSSLILLVLCLVDLNLTYSRGTGLTGSRKLPKLLGLGDEYQVQLEINSQYQIPLKLEIYEELPYSFQERNFKLEGKINALGSMKANYSIRPLERGLYNWGLSNVVIKSPLGLIGRKFELNSHTQLACYPSLLQMRNFELKAFARVANFQGIKRVRRLGHSYEFEQIKPYVIGDEARSVNWKATSRKNNLMVNQYEDERSQQVYCVIDKSRSMHMPFDGLSLLDYAINTSLVISNIAIKKYDKAGLLSFSDKLGRIIKAEHSRTQLKKIHEVLFKEHPRDTEANFDLLYQSIKRTITVRSLLFLFSNFESSYSLERALPLLRKISRSHLLVVVLFNNRELEEYSREKAVYIHDIYTQTLAQKLLDDKRTMATMLHQYGIQTIFTDPSDLSLNSVNKYLELKSKGLI